MPITELQREARKHRLGASDVAAIMVGGGYDVWLQKTGKVLVDSPDSEAMNLGNDLEEAILAWAGRELGVDLEINVEVAHDELPIVAILDALVDGTSPLDAKTTGLAVSMNTRYRLEGGYMRGYGEPDTDQVPDSVSIQLTTQIACCRVHYGAAVGDGLVAALIAGRGRNIFRVRWDAELWDMIMERAGRFWNYNVMRDIPPDDSKPSWEYARHVEVKRGTSIVVPASIVRAYDAAVAESKAAEKRKEALKAEIATMGAEYLLPGVEGEKVIHVNKVEMPETEVRFTRKAGVQTRVSVLKQLPRRVKLIGLDEVKQIEETDEVEAGQAYDTAARRLFGEYAKCNFPIEKEMNNV